MERQAFSVTFDLGRKLPRPATPKVEPLDRFWTACAWLWRFFPVLLAMVVSVFVAFVWSRTGAVDGLGTFLVFAICVILPTGAFLSVQFGTPASAAGPVKRTVYVTNGAAHMRPTRLHRSDVRPLPRAGSFACGTGGTLNDGLAASECRVVNLAAWKRQRPTHTVPS